MCGRFTLDTDYAKIKKQFGIHQIEPLPGSFNVAPTETALCLMNTDEGLEAVQMRWGIVSWYVTLLFLSLCILGFAPVSLHR
ncbi:SOS response-associated peptidase family protein [Legionella jamestowniensis]|uniref:Abasic site processing protein n=1 Tax=Legionella jamestowniensis TaxID=455 RepID=A0A0W0UNC2_9GAMM|nr:SOS response-associated peptidase family protein [Legionella jamestowniensis]KTD09276.1 hypothetical protein Ljam_0626 [Legionella jamestowniensis]OCH99124.1 hypothetical protein A8135_07655 [Legionella jamestowniensis]SFL86932.1 Uncharacterised ACR, COG2135 [Legionella jamestowniensis DSM 19215]